MGLTCEIVSQVDNQHIPNVNEIHFIRADFSD